MDYYKILNAEECQHGLQYHTGLNIDPIPFSKGKIRIPGDGLCRRGGIHFARKDILAFLNYGPYIRKVILPDDAQLYQGKDKVPEKFKADKVILDDRRKISAKLISELIKEGADVNCYCYFPLYWAVINNYSKVVKVLLNNGANIHFARDYVLQIASRNGYTKIVRMLLNKNADVSACNGLALTLAIEGGHNKIIELLKKY